MALQFPCVYGHPPKNQKTKEKSFSIIERCAKSSMLWSITGRCMAQEAPSLSLLLKIGYGQACCEASQGSTWLKQSLFSHYYCALCMAKHVVKSQVMCMAQSTPFAASYFKAGFGFSHVREQFQQKATANVFCRNAVPRTCLEPPGISCCSKQPTQQEG